MQHPKLPSLWSFSCHIGHCVWYEQNPSRDVGGVAHTRFQDVHTDGRTYVQRSANLNALPQFCTGTAFSG